MVGDIRAMWPLNTDGTDASIKGQHLTNNNSVTFASSGVRGTAADFVAASSMSLSDADHADYTFTTSFSAGLWFKREVDSGSSEGLISKWDQDSGADRSFFIYTNGSEDKVF